VSYLIQASYFCFSSGNLLNGGNSRRELDDVLRRQDTEQSNILSNAADSETVDRLFKMILGRDIGNDEFKRAVDRTDSVGYWVQRLIDSEEFRLVFARKTGLKPPRGNGFIDDASYRTPTLGTQTYPSRVLVTGSCLTGGWKAAIEAAYPGTEIRHQLFNNASALEDFADDELKKASFQIIQIPIRSLLRESEYFLLTLTEAGIAELGRIFRACVLRLRTNLDAALKYNRATGLPAFVLNLTRPQANPLGRLLPKYELSNFSTFIDQLNRELDAMIATERAVCLIDYDEIASTLGKRFVQDDLTSHVNHGSNIVPSHGGYDIELTPPGSIEELYEPKNREMALAIFNECVAAYHTLSPSNKIKIVIFDLDGTLWRGVPADGDDIGPHLTEGWPLSILEAAEEAGNFACACQ
jgi:hypothetical protein